MDDKPKGGKKQQDDIPRNKKTKNADETKQLLIKHCVWLIKYISRLRKFSYVCQTEKKNKIGINVIRNFYTDENGNTMTDTE